MACYNPLRVWRSKTINETGKRSMVFNRSAAQFADISQEIPCGQCIGCRLERSRQWAIRCVHEASLYEENCFLTLTYNNENLPENNTLVVKDFQNFMKRLRKKYPLKKSASFNAENMATNTLAPTIMPAFSITISQIKNTIQPVKESPFTPPTP